LLDWNSFRSLFIFQASIKNKLLKALGASPINIKKSLKEFKQYRTRILPLVKDTFQLLKKAFSSGKWILFEGAHGVMLDLDWSPYPFATASNTVVGAVNAGSGISNKNIGNVIGVVKAFTSRVGSGPFPTEISGKLAGAIRERGGEYGTTSGRPRRIGWLDLEAVKFSCQLNNVDELVITKLDILSGIIELKVCTGYELKGKRISYSECGYKELFTARPIYKSFPGWLSSISGVRKYSDLPSECKNYIKFIEKFTGVKAKFLSVGAERNSNIYPD
jgi:adenylosuccinate synthase